MGGKTMCGFNEKTAIHSRHSFCPHLRLGLEVFTIIRT